MLREAVTMVLGIGLELQQASISNLPIHTRQVPHAPNHHPTGHDCQEEAASPGGAGTGHSSAAHCTAALSDVWEVNYSSSDEDIFKDIIENSDGGKVGLEIFKWKIHIFFQLFKIVMMKIMTVIVNRTNLVDQMWLYKMLLKPQSDSGEDLDLEG